MNVVYCIMLSQVPAIPPLSSIPPPIPCLYPTILQLPLTLTRARVSVLALAWHGMARPNPGPSICAGTPFLECW